MSFGLPSAMPSRRFPKPWTVEPMPSGYRVIDANGVVLAHVYGQPDGAIAASDTRLTNDEARRISKLISRLPELVEVERDRNKARSRRKPQPLRFKPVTIGDLIREGKLLEVHCGNCRPERHLYLNPEILRLPKRMPVPEVARHLVCSKCGARNSETYQSDLGEAGCKGRRCWTLSQRLRERSQTPTIAEASCRQFSCCVQLSALERRPPLGRPFL